MDIADSRHIMFPFMVVVVLGAFCMDGGIQEAARAWAEEESPDLFLCVVGVQFGPSVVS